MIHEEPCQIPILLKSALSPIFCCCKNLGTEVALFREEKMNDYPFFPRVMSVLETEFEFPAALRQRWHTCRLVLHLRGVISLLFFCLVWPQSGRFVSLLSSLFTLFLSSFICLSRCLKYYFPSRLFSSLKQSVHRLVDSSKWRINVLWFDVFQCTPSQFRAVLLFSLLTFYIH